MTKKFDGKVYFKLGFDDAYKGLGISTFNCKDNKALEDAIQSYYMCGYNDAKKIFAAFDEEVE